MEELIKIVEKFDIPHPIESVVPITSGLINHTYLVATSGSDNPDFILQKKNKNIFKNIPAMMDNICKVTLHIRNKIKDDGGSPEREVMTVIYTKEGIPYFIDKDGEYWTMSLFIPDTVAYEVAENAELARKGGEGIGKFQQLLADFSAPLFPVIEGFHDLKFRFRQWDEALKNGNKDRIKEARVEIEKVEKRRGKMEAFWQLVESGKLPKRVTHNDTKLSNILFHKKGDGLCVIDLDTVMTNTPLADVGDAIRTFANTGKEDEKKLENVELDMEKYDAYMEGYLKYMRNMLSPLELGYLPFAPQYITYEQIMRFLMDYIQNDVYYKIEYPKHNLIRTRAQLKLLESMEEKLNKNEA